MNHVTALLAFSAIMIVLTTLATVVVEGVHKLLNQRAADFDAMLTQLFEKSVKPALTQEFKGQQDIACQTEALTAGEFVSQIIENPAFSKSEKSWRDRIPVVKNLFRKSFDQLTTRQFAEQLSRTKVGNDLANLGDLVAKSVIQNLSYEFERYGEAATMYFKRRASVLSVMVAMILAFSINIDAFRLYGALARDNDLASQIIANIDVERLEAAYASQDDARSPDDVLQQIKTEARQLEELGLPVGHNFFPYCSEGSMGNLEPADLDARCDGVPTVLLSSDLPVIGSAIAAAGAAIATTYNRLTTGPGISWILSVLVTGGLIGLGAPFWFKTYQFIVNYVPGVTSPDRTLARQTRSGTSADVATVPSDADTPLPGRDAFSLSDYLKYADAGDTESSEPVVVQSPQQVAFMSNLGLSGHELYHAFLQGRAGVDDRDA